MRQVKELEEKFTFKVAKNRNKTWLNQLRANAWLSMGENSWIKCICKIGEVIVDETDEQEEIKKDTVIIKENDLNKELTLNSYISTLTLKKKGKSLRNMK